MQLQSTSSLFFINKIGTKPASHLGFNNIQHSISALRYGSNLACWFIIGTTLMESVDIKKFKKDDLISWGVLAGIILVLYFVFSNG